MKNLYLMKHILHLLTFIACLLYPISTQAGYYIHQLTGDVKIYANDRLITPQRRASVSLSDRFVLQSGAMLAIADSESKRVYVTRTAGTQNVAQIISAARRQASHTTALALQQMQESATGKMKNITVQGAVNRGNGNGGIIETRVHAALLRHLQKPGKEKKPSLILQRIAQGDTWHFNVVNHTDNVLFVNVLTLRKGHSPHLCLDTDGDEGTVAIAVAPSGETALTQFLFTADGSADRYLLFASEQPFDSSTLQMLFDTGVQPDKGTKPLPLLFCPLD